MAAQRTYPAGRPIDGFDYGGQVETVADVAVGELLINDSHQFKATNLIRVTQKVVGRHDSRFIAVYCHPNGKRFGPEEFCVWCWDLTKERFGLFSYYRAVPHSDLNGVRCGRCQHQAEVTVKTRLFGEEHVCKPCAAALERDSQIVAGS